MTTEAAPGFRADSIAVERFSFEVREDRDAAKPLEQPATTFRIRSTIDRSAKRIRVVASLAAVDPKGKLAAIVSEARIVAMFSWMDPVQLPVEEFARLNAAAFLWPYARELVWNCTVRSGLPPLLLPILNFSSVQVEVEDATPPPPTAALR